MVSIKWKYVNRNLFPVYLPDSHGGSTLFVPGAWKDHLWWSRFLGPAQLVKEPLAATDIQDKNKIRRKHHKKRANIQFIPWSVGKRRRPVHGSNRRRKNPDQSACATSCMVACETSTQDVSSNENWVTIGNTHFCKHCDWKTVDIALLPAHFNAYHVECEENADYQHNSA